MAEIREALASDRYRGWFYYLGVHPTHQKLGYVLENTSVMGKRFEEPRV